MATLKYTIVKSQEQYKEYSDILETLIGLNYKNLYDEIELLTLLIEKWDKDHNTFIDSDPIKILKALINDHNLKAKDLIEILALSKGTISKILNYRKGLSKETIRKLSDYFKVSQEAFNRPYRLINEANKHVRNAGLKNTKKNLLEVR